MSAQIFEILDEGGAVINRIVACQAFVEQAYPGRWRQVAALLEPAAPPPVPTRITRAQGKAALVRAGLWGQAIAYIKTLESDEKLLAEIALNDTNEWERGSPFLLVVAKHLGLSAEKLDELFAAAAEIEL